MTEYQLLRIVCSAIMDTEKLNKNLTVREVGEIAQKVVDLAKKDALLELHPDEQFEMMMESDPEMMLY